MIQTPWAVLRCKFKDNDSEPYGRQRYDDLFTSSGVGKLNMVDFFRDMSHGQLDLSGSRVFGWYTLDMNRSDYLAGLVAGLTQDEIDAAITKARNDLIALARQAASADLTNNGPFFSVVVCMNVPTDLFGGGTGAVCDDGRWPEETAGPGMSSMSPSLLGQEMGHVYGLAHSRADGSTADYNDPWDVMSNAARFMSPHPNFTDLDVRARPVFRLGPGLNAANMAGRGWLDESRVWSTSNESFDTVVTLRPLHRRDLSGFLAARLGKFLIEFRIKEGWDAALDRPAVLIHRFDGNQSYLMSASNGAQDVVTGGVFGTVETTSSHAAIFTGATGVEVVEINPNERFARIRLVQRPAFEEPSLGGMLFGGATGGYLIVGKGIRRIPPDSPLTPILDQVAAYDSSEAIVSVHLRTAVRRETLSTIASLVKNHAQTLQTFQEPATTPYPKQVRDGKPGSYDAAASEEGCP
jgi:M6 family metalloprotease-like protein